MKKIFLFGFVFISLSISAQDFHYTMWNYSPLTLNPANTGVINSQLRVVNNYRNQWMSVSKEPYKQIAISVDAPFLKKKFKRGSYFGAGFCYDTDKEGLAKMKTTQYVGLLSYTQSLSQAKINKITVGFSAAYILRRFSLGGLKWDSQWNGQTFDPGLGSGEGGGFATANFDFSAGLLWNYSKTERKKYWLGAAYQHITNPPLSFSDIQYPRYTLHGGGQFRTTPNSNTYIRPGVIAAVQGPTLLVNAGADVKYVLQDRSKYTGYQNDMAIHFGAWYRFADALMLTTRFDYGQFSAGISYDFNISGLTVISKSRGGFEVNFIWNGVFGQGPTVPTTKASFNN